MHKYAAKYINYGKVLTKGYTVSARYGFGNWVSIGGNFTKMDVRDNMKTSISSSAENLAYKERMPNLPYMFADSDIFFASVPRLPFLRMHCSSNPQNTDCGYNIPLPRHGDPAVEMASA